MGAVFINYRREETAGEARALFNDLVAELGEGSVFMDVDNIALGRDFREVIQERLASSDLMLALVGKNWVNATNRSGRRRLDDANDFVRLEIENALKRNIPVTPVLLQGAQMPSVEELPESLRAFAYRNGFELTHNRWESDVHEMMKRLGLGVSQEARAPSRKEAAATASPRTADASARSPSIEPRVGGPGPTLALPPGRSRWPLLVGAVAVAIALSSGGLLYHQAAQEKTRAEQAEKDRLAATQAAQAAQRAAAQAESERAAAMVQAEKDRLAAQRAAAQAEGERAAAVVQAEKDRLAAQRAAAQAERDRLAAVQAEKDRQAAEQVAKERALAAQAERERAAAASQQAEKNRLAAAQQAERAAQAAPPVNLNGIWREPNGNTAAIQQNGNTFTFVASVVGKGVVGGGQGVINGRKVVLRYPAKGGGVGEATLMLSPDGTELRGYYRSPAGESGETYMRKVAAR